MSIAQKVALFIDADNAQPCHLQELINKLKIYGKVCTKRAFGNWEKHTLNRWKNVLATNGIVPIQQFDLTKHKNASDISLTINVMDFIYQHDFNHENYAAIAFMTSDCDFTPLVTRVRQTGVHVICAGESKAPQALQVAATDFILLEGGISIINSVVQAKPQPQSQKQGKAFRLVGDELKIKNRLSSSLSNKKISLYVKRHTTNTNKRVMINTMIDAFKVRTIPDVDHYKICAHILNNRSEFNVSADLKKLKLK